jgi:hypothetical protein
MLDITSYPGDHKLCWRSQVILEITSYPGDHRLCWRSQVIPMITRVTPNCSRDNNSNLIYHGNIKTAVEIKPEISVRHAVHNYTAHAQANTSKSRCREHSNNHSNCVTFAVGKKRGDVPSMTFRGTVTC